MLGARLGCKLMLGLFGRGVLCMSLRLPPLLVIHQAGVCGTGVPPLVAQPQRGPCGVHSPRSPLGEKRARLGGDATELSCGDPVAAAAD